MKHNNSVIKIIALMLCICMLIPLAGCGEAEMLQDTIFAMNDSITLTAYGKQAQKGIDAAKSIISALDSAIQPDLATSYVYAMNNAGGASVVVPGQVAEMIKTAKEVYERSNGALDLTIYPVIKLWGFHNRKYYVPTDEELAIQMKKLCFNDLILTSFPSSGSYTVQMPFGTELSFASIGRGCASQNAVEAMRQAGVESGIISMGGNVQTLGTKPDGTNWDVAVSDPANMATYLGVLSVGETAVSTCNSMLCYFEDMNENIYHHILSPVSGYPTSNSLVSVTIVCDDGLKADALATAMFVLGTNRALNYWRTYGDFDMILVTNDNQVICTSGLLEEFTLVSNNYTLTYSE